MCSIPIVRFKHALWIATVFRLCLIIYGEIHDRHSDLKYTDIDYRVFSDAAAFLTKPDALPNFSAVGPLSQWLGLNVGNPYQRDTYRYTPLLALLLVPNQLIHPLWGKIIFAGCDIGVGILLQSINLKSWSRRSDSPSLHVEEGARWIAAIWLLNPMVANISTRGSAESILGLMVISCLASLLRRAEIMAAMLFGLAVHFKIYPIIYVSSILVLMAREDSLMGAGVARSGWLSWRQIKFGTISFGTFAVLGGIMYSFWGMPFVQHTYLYHLTRRDHRHNFSLYFYPTYLSYPAKLSGMLSIGLISNPLISFLPQMLLAVGSGAALLKTRDDLPFTWFIQTMLFVNLNKVCTSQYFMWSMWFLPLILPRLTMSIRRATITILVWVGAQAIWLGIAYQLELLGRDVFGRLWVASAIMLASNCFALVQIIKAYRMRSSKMQ